MAVLTMPLRQAKAQRLLSATLRELCRILSSFPSFRMNEQECCALAAAALGGQPEAEFTVASVFDAAGHSARAVEWYHRAASRNYLPAMLQLVALR